MKEIRDIDPSFHPCPFLPFATFFFKQFDYPFESADNRLPADAFAIALEALGLAVRGSALSRPREAHRPDVLLLAAPGGAGNPGNRQGQRSLAAAYRAERHFPPGSLAHG